MNFRKDAYKKNHLFAKHINFPNVFRPRLEVDANINQNFTKLDKNIFFITHFLGKITILDF
ncbi:hypothetical protein FXR79_07825 [Campylobacter coli]|nr:hypothetical protein [Campylobacter coli]